MSVNAIKVALIVLLTGVFLLDDVLIYLLLKNLFDLKIKPLPFGIGATIVLGLNFFLALVVFNIMQKKPTTGQQGMIGKTGFVIKRINGEGKVEIYGEIWKAECEEPLKVGEKIIVEKVEGLKLIVKKYVQA
ncbi:MAG: NfeD family protein [bacterium]